MVGAHGRCEHGLHDHLTVDHDGAIDAAAGREDRDLPRHDELRRMGPDLLDPGFDAAEALRRLRDRPAAAIGDALLNQRVLAGIGNVYKSEVLFVCRVPPFAVVRDLPDAVLSRLIESGRRLLRANVAEGPASNTRGGFRRTTGRMAPGERLWVYGRARLPCRRCGTPIAVRAHGPDARLTYWCPTCQPS